MASYIAVDIGSSYIKSAILDVDRRALLAMRRENTPAPVSGSGNGQKERRHETDAERIVGIVREMIDDHLALRPEAQGVLLSTQMHGFVLAGSDRQAVTPYISWQDERCMEPVEDGSARTHLDLLRAQVSEEDLAATGIDLKPGLAMCNVFHLLRHHADVRGEAGIRFCTLGSYIILRLTGEHVCHLTNAAATGFADIRSGAWNRRLIEAAGCGTMSFPQIRGETEAAGWYRGSATAGSVHIPIYPDIGDHQASVLGSLAVPQQDTVLTIGTAGIMSRLEEEYRPGAYEIRPFVGGLWLNTLTRLPGGRNLDVLADFVKDIGETILGCQIEEAQLWSGLLQAADRAGDRGRLEVSVGFFSNQRGVREGALSGVDATNLRIGPIVRGALDNMADIYVSLLEQLHGARPETTRRLMFSGGVLSRNKLLAELISQRSGIPGIWSPVQDEVFAGLYRVALLCSGRCRSYDETRRLMPESLD